jgi:hypothetical protein
VSLLLVQVAGRVNYSLSGASGSYSYAGQNATFNVGRHLSGTSGSYIYTGQAATFKVGRFLQGSFGAYTYAGQNATLTYTPGAGAVAYSLSGEPGSYSYTGFDGTFNYVQPVSNTGPGAGHPTVYWQTGRKKRLRRADLDLLLDRVIQEYYEEIVDKGSESSAEKAARIVKPFAEDRAVIPRQVDWMALEADLKRVKMLLALWKEEVEDDEDEDLLLIL